MKRNYILTIDDCWVGKGAAWEMGVKMNEFSKLTGKDIYYEHQGYNGKNGSNYISIVSPEYNSPLGELAIEVKGYRDAIKEITKLINNYKNYGVLFDYEVRAIIASNS